MSDSDKVEDLLADLDHAITAFHAAICSPKGVVPISFDEMYDPTHPQIVQDALRPAKRSSADLAIDRFAERMKAKMARSAAKGRTGWDDPTDMSDAALMDEFLRHVDKQNEGTWLDLALFAMFLDHRAANPAGLADAQRRRDARLADGT